MSLATIINPLAPEDEVLLFYCTQNSNLALEHRPLSPSAAQPPPFQDNGNVGPILSPGDFAAVRHSKTVAVYGIIKWTGPDGSFNKAVSLLSPVWNPIESVLYATSAAKINPGNYWALAATSNNQERDYIYYLQEQSGTAGKPQILECSMSGENPTIIVLDECVPIPQSRLASCYDFKRDTRLVFFQARDGNLQWVNLIDRTPMKIRNTTAAARGTPLGVATVLQPDNSMTIYLYFVDNANNLMKTVHQASDPDDVWSPAHTPDSSPPVDPSSGISAIADPQQPVNHVFYLPNTGGATFVDYNDNFASFESTRGWAPDSQDDE